jgi:hypothetical protein
MKGGAYTGHTQKNGAVLIVNTTKTAPFFCVCPVHSEFGENVARPELIPNTHSLCDK